jgi:purine nucleoside phosphorylase
MHHMKQRLEQTTDFINSRIKQAPYIGILTGTGLGESAESMVIDTAIDYKEIPHAGR